MMTITDIGHNDNRLITNRVTDWRAITLTAAGEYVTTRFHRQQHRAANVELGVALALWIGTETRLLRSSEKY
jgi:exonuclease VII large subunit